MPVSVDTINTALNRLSRLDLSTYDATELVEHYMPLVRLFELIERTGQSDIKAAVELVKAGGYACYGWMPTMLKHPPSDQQARRILEFVEKSRGEKALPADAEIRGVITTFNKSVVGTSKFLHFALPNKFPIWDSIVARSLGVSGHYNLSQPDVYMYYFNAVHDWLRGSFVIPKNFTDRLQKVPQSNELSEVRCLELALYVLGKNEANQEVANATEF